MSTVQKEKDSLWMSVTQEHRITKTMVCGAHRPDRFIQQVQGTVSGGDIIKSDNSLTCMAIIYLTTCWFEIFGVPMFDLDEIMGRRNEYIDN